MILHDILHVAGLLGYFKRQYRHIPSRLKCYSWKSVSQVCIHYRVTAKKTMLCGELSNFMLCVMEGSAKAQDCSTLK